MKHKAVKEHPHKILIIKPSSLGDVVHSLPFLNVMNKRFPKAEIHWIIARGIEGILEDNPMIHKLIVIDKDNWKKMHRLVCTIKELYLIYRLLRKEQYDLVVDLQGLLRSGIFAAVTHAPVRAGFYDAREGSNFFYTNKIRVKTNAHAVDRNLEIADFFDCDISDVRFPLPLSGTQHAPIEASFFHERYAVLVPGARWQSKRWSPEKFGELAARLPVKSVIVGGKEDVADSECVMNVSHGKAVSFTGRTSIKELINIIRHAQFVVSNDSGPMHVAASLNVPVFAIFGPTNPERTGPYGKGHIVIRKNLECSPCYKKRCSNLKCLNMISVDEVVEAIFEKISK